MILDSTPAQRVARGARLLDKRRPGWAEEIDTERLLMASGSFDPDGWDAPLFGGRCGCILAQLDAAVPEHTGEGQFIHAAMALFGFDDHRAFDPIGNSRVALQIALFGFDSMHWHDRRPVGSYDWDALHAAWLDEIEARTH